MSTESLKKSKFDFSMKTVVLIAAFLIVASIDDAPNVVEKQQVQTVEMRESTLDLLKKRALTHSIKKSAPVDIKIEASKETLDDGEQSTLTATVKAKKDLENFGIQWAIPSDFLLVSGPENQKIQSLTRGESISFEITLESFTDDNFPITFILQSLNPNQNFRKTARYQSQDEIELRKEKKKLAQRSQKRMKSKPSL